MRLSTAGIITAVVVTCAALIAIAVAVGPSGGEANSISFEAPEASVSAPSVAPALYAGGKMQAVAGSVPVVTGQ